MKPGDPIRIIGGGVYLGVWLQPGTQGEIERIEDTPGGRLIIGKFKAEGSLTLAPAEFEVMGKHGHFWGRKYAGKPDFIHAHRRGEIPHGHHGARYVREAVEDAGK